MIPGIALSPFGALVLPDTLPASAPIGLELTRQSLAPDSAAPAGAAATNGLTLRVH